MGDRIDSFQLRPGTLLAGNYVVEHLLGSGWEGEVYKVVERRTGVPRAAKLFKPQRNPGDRAVKFYAHKLERLRGCSIVIQYHNSAVHRWRGRSITSLISEYVDGELLGDFIARQPARRLRPFEALHLIYPLVKGLEEIHRRREYHGDLHASNVMVRRRGIFFDVKIVDFYHWGRPSAARYQDDVADAARLLYDAVGGARTYREQPASIKGIVRGLRRDLIARAFPTAAHLREHLESFTEPAR